MKHTLALLTGLLLLVGESSAALVHRWSFDTDGTDSIGSADASLMDGASVSGGQLQLDGSNDYAILPIDSILSTLGSSTFEAWVTYDLLASWGRIFDFGNGNAASSPGAGYFFLTGSPNYGSGPTAFAQFSITETTSASSENVYAGALPGGGTELHYAVTIDGGSNTATVYIDGSEKLSGSITLTPEDVVSVDGTEHNWLGRSRFTSDAFLDGSINEFRIYDSALTGDAIASSFALGPNTVPEPSRLLLSLVGIAAIALRRRRR
jgi:hypothetical protein